MSLTNKFIQAVAADSFQHRTSGEVLRIDPVRSGFAAPSVEVPNVLSIQDPGIKPGGMG